MITEVTSKITSANDIAKAHLNHLTVQQHADLLEQFSDRPAVTCLGFTLGNNFNYVAFLGGETPEDGDWVYTPDSPTPIRYRQQPSAKKIIGFSIGGGRLL